MREPAPRTRRWSASPRLVGQLVDQLVGVGAGVLAAFAAATVLLAFGSSSSATLEDVYEPSSSAGRLPPGPFSDR